MSSLPITPVPKACAVVTDESSPTVVSRRPASHVTSADGGSEADFPSPAPSTGSVIVHPSPNDAADSPSTQGPSPDSSYELVPSPDEEFVDASEHLPPSGGPAGGRRASTDSRRASTDSAGSGRVLPTSLLSFPPKQKVTLTAPDPNSPPKRSERNRAWSQLSLREPGSAPLLLPADDSSQRRRPSYDSSRRSSLAPTLAPIPDDRVLGLDPEAHVFSPTHFEHLDLQQKFHYIVKHGKQPDGELSKHARQAMRREGLRGIPSLQGPLSLPYARCPSGIDAFIYSADKDEDPWTFMLDDGNRRRRGPFKPNPVALPGNARYAQATHIQHGRLPNTNRVVSGPAVFSHQDQHTTQLQFEYQQHPSPPVAPRSRKPSVSFAPPPSEPSATVAQILAAHHASLYLQHNYAAPVPQYVQPAADEWSVPAFRPPSASGTATPLVLAADPYSRPPSTVLGHPYAAWSSYGFPPTLGSLLPQHLVFNPAPYVDPAIVAAFGPQDLDANASSYCTADSDEESDLPTPSANHFLFPAHPPPVRWASNTSLMSAIATPPRRPSIPTQPLQPVANADRRNSAAPVAGNRRMSLAPAVTVSTRRQSVAAQTRLVRDSSAHQSHATRQPRAPPTEQLVPHHSRPSSISALFTAAKTVPATPTVVESPEAAPAPVPTPKLEGRGGSRGRGGRGRGKRGASARGRGGVKSVSAAE